MEHKPKCQHTTRPLTHSSIDEEHELLAWIPKCTLCDRLCFQGRELDWQAGPWSDLVSGALRGRASAPFNFQVDGHTVRMSVLLHEQGAWGRRRHVPVHIAASRGVLLCGMLNMESKQRVGSSQLAKNTG